MHADLSEYNILVHQVRSLPHFSLTSHLVLVVSFLSRLLNETFLPAAQAKRLQHCGSILLHVLPLALFPQHRLMKASTCVDCLHGVLIRSWRRRESCGSSM